MRTLHAPTSRLLLILLTASLIGFPLAGCFGDDDETITATTNATPSQPQPIVEQNAGQYEQLAANYVSEGSSRFFVDSALCGDPNSEGSAACTVFFCVAENPGDITDACPPDKPLQTTDTICGSSDMGIGCGLPPAVAGAPVQYAAAPAQPIQYVQMPAQQQQQYHSGTDQFMDFYMDMVMISMMSDMMGGGYGGGRGGSRWDSYDDGYSNDYRSSRSGSRDRYNSRTTTNTTVTNNYYKDTSGKSSKGKRSKAATQSYQTKSGYKSGGSRGNSKSKSTAPVTTRNTSTKSSRAVETGYHAGTQGKSDKAKAKAKSTSGYKSGTSGRGDKATGSTQGTSKPKAKPKSKPRTTSKPSRSRSRSSGRRSGGSRSRRSSEIWKADVMAYTNGLEVVQQLHPVTWTWNPQANVMLGPDERTASIGFIAEDVSKIAPELVVYEDGAPAGIHYDLVSVVLVRALVEQQAQIDALSKQCVTKDDDPAPFTPGTEDLDN